ncbi:UDP-N-acetylglucosamine 2-epimerase (hydrolyzing) [Phytoactinopolyspora alkaliphila]|uniref:UDP-N-acetylglucosamine 2-epimerase (Hydrolyzing) n=1 Tax=Phytoactinopolyspora alkaliphila TaxID=1783498 RepID=A0A6N9YNF6_9ACTN|nr:UDP-N-acetylglucosamine 2-epimerase (hydrolyzing) [Phytoactinopolyspora alkaliphila]
MQRARRRICVFTGSRADYSPLASLIRRLNSDDEVDLRLLVSGGHLVGAQGRTIREILDDGVTIDETVDMVLAGDSPAAVTKSFGLACAGYADALERISPDLLLIAGDRYEALAAATSALFRLTPVAHVAGGQLTRGSIDDQMRHAISKLAHLHFVFSPADRRRLIHMGEQPRHIHTVGPIGIDPDTLRALPDPKDLEEAVGLPLRPPTFLITHHPATADPDGSWESTRNLLAALDRFPRATLVFTAPNVDRGSQRILDAMREYAADRPDRAVLVPSLGQVNYLGLLRHADLVLGNSSSGLIEAPVLGTPTVNVGDRQAGRPRAETVIDCGTGTDEVADGIRRALDMPEPFPWLDDEIASADGRLTHVVDVLKSAGLDELIPKQFHETSADSLSGEVIH